MTRCPGNKDLGNRLRAYALKSGKTATDMSGEMKFPIKSTMHKNYHHYNPIPGKGTVQKGVAQISTWLRGEHDPSEQWTPVVEDYLRRMKA